jgi:phosphoribosyl 1,2-cyclic phosphodiesterase
MAVRLAVLASGSSGNSTYLEADGFGLLIDAGLGPRQLAARLAAVGASWPKVHAAILTHTHGDHWNDRSVGHLLRANIPLYCHAAHHEQLLKFSPSFTTLADAGLVRGYNENRDLWLTPGLRCRPLELHHDSDPTFGFRLDGGGPHGATWSFGYAADLGCWLPAQADTLANTDVLALEFNHDEDLERASRRPAELIQRVLGNYGHLSNDQAASFLTAILDRSEPGQLRHLIQLHLSRECNRPLLAQQAARKALPLAGGVSLHTAAQHCAGPVLTLETDAPKRRWFGPPTPAIRPVPRVNQPCLPGME